MKYVETRILRLLKDNNLNQASITESLNTDSKINKSSVSRSLKQLLKKDIIRKMQDGTYQYRFGNDRHPLFNNPDKLLFNLLKRIIEMDYTVIIDREDIVIKEAFERHNGYSIRGGGMCFLAMREGDKITYCPL